MFLAWATVLGVDSSQTLKQALDPSDKTSKQKQKNNKKQHSNNKTQPIFQKLNFKT